jgi:hypothetical protein
VNLKFGRKPVQHTPESLRRAVVLASHLDQLGPPPRNSDNWAAAVQRATNSDWQMEGNDTVGDCTIADAAHQHMLWTANTGKIEVPTTQQTLDCYSAVTGYNPADPSTDKGAMIADVCAYIEQHGFMGNRLEGYADVVPSNHDHVRWGVQLFGSVKIGLNLPQSAVDQFNAGQGWKYTGDQNIVGGHDVCVVKYVHNVWYVVTWGKMITMGPEFFSHYCEEVKVPLAMNWCRAGGFAPSKLNLAQLTAELQLEGPTA